MPGPDDLLQDMRDRLEAARKRKAAEYKRRWYLLHREQEIAKASKWQKDNREKYNAYQREWRRKNREKYNAYKREYNRRRKEARRGKMD